MLVCGLDLKNKGGKEHQQFQVSRASRFVRKESVLHVFLGVRADWEIKLLVATLMILVGLSLLGL